MSSGDEIDLMELFLMAKSLLGKIFDSLLRVVLYIRSILFARILLILVSVFLGATLGAGYAYINQQFVASGVVKSVVLKDAEFIHAVNALNGKAAGEIASLLNLTETEAKHIHSLRVISYRKHHGLEEVNYTAVDRKKLAKKMNLPKELQVMVLKPERQEEDQFVIEVRVVGKNIVSPMKVQEGLRLYLLGNEYLAEAHKVYLKNKEVERKLLYKQLADKDSMGVSLNRAVSSLDVKNIEPMLSARARSEMVDRVGEMAALSVENTKQIMFLQTRLAQIEEESNLFRKESILFVTDLSAFKGGGMGNIVTFAVDGAVLALITLILLIALFDFNKYLNMREKDMK